MKRGHLLVYAVIAVFLGALFLAALPRASRAFNGPPSGCTPPNCQGAVGVNSSNNLSVGTSTPNAATKLLVVASDTSASNYSLEIVQPADTPIFVVRNDGNVGVGTFSPSSALDVNGTLTASAFTGTLNAANVSAGTFGSNTGGGAYTFSGNLTAGNTTFSGNNIYNSAGTTLWLGNGSQAAVAFQNNNQPFDFYSGTSGTVLVAQVSSAGNMNLSGNVYTNNNNDWASSYTEYAPTTWDSYLTTNLDANLPYTITINMIGDNGNWNGTFAVQGSNSFAPNIIWDNVRLISWQGYNAARDDVRVLIMSNTATNAYGDAQIVIQTIGTYVSGAGGISVTVNGYNAHTLSLSSGSSAPYSYTMATSYGTYNIYQQANNVGIDTGGAVPGADVSMTGGIDINGTNSTQLEVQNSGNSAFALNAGVPGTGQWTIYDKANGGWTPDMVSDAGNISFNGQIIPSTVLNTGGGTWELGSVAWAGTVPGADSVTGLIYKGGSAGSQLFTLSSDPGQASMEMDGSLFLGDSAPSYNPYSLTAASDGDLAVNGNVEIGGNVNIQGTISSGGTAGLISAGNVSAGEFGSNAGGGNYSFPVLESLRLAIVKNGSESVIATFLG